MNNTTANETHISEQEKKDAFDILNDNGFVILNNDDLDYLESLNTQVLKHETDFERIHNS